MEATMMRSSLVRITRREKEILGLVVQGLSNQAVAQELVLSRLTVRNYVSQLISKFHVHNRTELAARWLHMEEKRRSHRRLA